MKEIPLTHITAYNSGYDFHLCPTQIAHARVRCHEDRTGCTKYDQIEYRGLRLGFGLRLGQRSYLTIFGADVVSVVFRDTHTPSTTQGRQC